MKSYSLHFHLIIIILTQGFLCAEIVDLSVTKELADRIADNQSSLIKADTSISKINDGKKTDKNINSYSSDSSIEIVFWSSDSSDKDDSCSSDTLSEDAFGLFEKLIKINEEGIQSVEDYYLRRSSIIYLEEILAKLINESTIFIKSSDNSKLLKFLNNQISLIDIFMKVFIYQNKFRNTKIFKNLLRKIVANFDFFDKSFLEIEKIINGVLSNNKKSNLKVLLKSLEKEKKSFEKVKKEFDKHKRQLNQVDGFNLTMKITALKEYKKNLIDKKKFINGRGEKIIVKQVKLYRPTFRKI
ncbi:hypothetical protein NBO_78g0001 [Nosema bombycis CQ1]|uniref:Uncharacterized protein n=1 Tax=Nosema bombycis (strain CQ1 / CVCC 102059) TaxID=578461 RepID=R0M5Z0_NOSB1|nr:hypothetical protein NBO_78g0001 [Nosema bombycis CQ1]|eukprot:EOB13374.1 hypothetical protein NBO_78g0001 [Nosema bombycis CQ1]